jgi:hypothetical protein
MIASLPVGKSLSNLKRRVTFDMIDAKKNTVKFSDTNTTSENGMTSTSLKNVTNNMEESMADDNKNEEFSEKFKVFPNSHKLK